MRTAARLTADEFARVPPVSGPCELVNGEIESVHRPAAEKFPGDVAPNLLRLLLFDVY